MPSSAYFSKQRHISISVAQVCVLLIDKNHPESFFLDDEYKVGNTSVKL